jgi:hypothetical protein
VVEVLPTYLEETAHLLLVVVIRLYMHMAEVEAVELLEHLSMVALEVAVGVLILVLDLQVLQVRELLVETVILVHRVVEVEVLALLAQTVLELLVLVEVEMVLHLILLEAALLVVAAVVEVTLL